MRIDDISVLGWLHTSACIVAMIAGPVIFALTKGTWFHRRAGIVYAMAMGIASITALGLFAPIPGLATFNRFHWVALATLVMVGLGVWAARHHRRALGAYAHPVFMIGSYYILVGGAINEAFARIGALWAMALAGSSGAQTLSETRMVGMTQGAAMMIFAAAILWVGAKVARARRTYAPA